MAVSDWVREQNSRRTASAQGVSQRQNPSGYSGLSTGNQPGTAAALKRLVQNRGVAENLASTGEFSGADQSFLDQVKGGAAWLFDKSGLDSVLDIADRGRRVMVLSGQDEPIFNPLTGLGVKLFQYLRGDEAADTKAGYEITPEDYADIFMGRTNEVEGRMGEAAADTLLGENRDVSFSAWMDANAIFTTEWVQSLPSWDVPGVGMVDPQSLASYGRFGAAVGGDMAADPLSYVTGGLGGVGKAAAKTAVMGVMHASMNRTVRFVASHADDAFGAIDDAVRAGTMSQIDAVAARRISVRAKTLIQEGSAKTWDEATDIAAGRRTFVEVANPEGKPVRVDLPSNNGIQETIIGPGVYDDMIQDIVQTIETKNFGRKGSEAWDAFKDFSNRNPDLAYATGGLRVGVGQASVNVPYVTQWTRGISRKGRNLVGRTKTSQRITGSDKWNDTWMRKWEGLRSRFSTDSPYGIAASKGTGPSTYTSYYMNTKVAPKSVLRALNINAETNIKTIASNQNAVETLIRKTVKNSDEADRYVADVKKAIASGSDTIPVLKSYEDLVPNIQKFSATIDEQVGELTAVLKQIAPDEASIFTQANYRPLIFAEDYMIQVNDLRTLYPDKLGIKGRNYRAGLKEMTEQFRKFDDTITEQDVETFLSVLNTAGDSASKTRPFGTASEMNWRKLARDVQMVDGEMVSGFDGLGNVNDSLMKTLAAASELTGYKSKASKRMAKETGTALQLDPAKQMQQYIPALEQMIMERTIVGEARAWRLMQDPIEVIDTDRLIALAEENGILKAAMEHLEAIGAEVDPEAMRQAMLHVAFTDVKLANGKTIKVADALMEDPEYQAVIENLQTAYRELVEMKNEFPHAYDSAVQSFVARGETEGMAHELAVAELIQNLPKLEASYMSDMNLILDRYIQEFPDAAVAAGARNVAEVQELAESSYSHMADAAAETMRGFRNEYIGQLTGQIADRPTLNLLDSADFDSILESMERMSKVRSDAVVTAVDATVDRANQILREAELAGADLGQLKVLRHQARQRELFAETMKASLKGEELPAHNVGRVTLPDRPEVEVFTTRINDPNVEVTPHFRGVQERGARAEGVTANRYERVREADAAVFFFHPSMVEAGEETARLIRHRALGTPIGAKIPADSNWFDEALTPVAPGVYVSKDQSRNVIVLSDLPAHPQDQNDLVNAVHRELTRRSDELGRELDIVVEMPSTVRPGFTRTEGLRFPATAETLAKQANIAENFPGYSRQQIADAIVAANQDKLVKGTVSKKPKLKVAKTPKQKRAEAAVQKKLRELQRTRGPSGSEASPSLRWRPEDLEEVNQAYLAGFVWDEESSRWVASTVDSGYIVDPVSGDVIAVSEWDSVLKLDYDDINEIAESFPKFLDSAEMERFEATRLPDAPEIASEAQQQARLGEQGYLGEGVRDEAQTGARVTTPDDDVAALMKKRDRLLDETDRVIDRMEAADPATKEQIRVNEYSDLQYELDQIDEQIAVIRDVEDFGGKPDLPTGRKTTEAFEPEVTDLADDTRQAFDETITDMPDAVAAELPAARLDSIEKALKQALAGKGVNDVDRQAIAEDYLLRLLGAEAEVTEVGARSVGAADIGELLEQHQRNAIDNLTRFFRVRSDWNEGGFMLEPKPEPMVFPVGTKLDIPPVAQMLEDQIRFGPYKDGVPIPERLKNYRDRKPAAGVTYSVERAVLEERRRVPTRWQGVSDIDGNWERGPKFADYGGHSQPTHRQTGNQLLPTARAYGTQGMAGRQGWYNPKTHIVIATQADSLPSGGVNVGRPGGLLASLEATDDAPFTVGKGFGNPYTTQDALGKNRTVPKGQTVVADEEEAVRKYNELLWEIIESDPAKADAIADLSGQTLKYSRREGRSMLTHSEPLADAADYLASKGYGTKGRVSVDVDVDDEVLNQLRGEAVGAEQAIIPVRGTPGEEAAIGDAYAAADRLTAYEGGARPEAFDGPDELMGPKRKALFDEKIEEQRQLSKERNDAELAGAPEGTLAEIDEQIQALELEITRINTEENYLFPGSQVAPDAAVRTRLPIEKPTPPNRRPIVEPLDPTVTDEATIRNWFRNKELQEKSLYGPDDRYEMDFGFKRESVPGDFQELGADAPAAREFGTANPGSPESATNRTFGRHLSDAVDERKMRGQRALDDKGQTKPNSYYDFDPEIDVNKPDMVQEMVNERGRRSNIDQVTMQADMETYVAETLGRIFQRNARSAPDRLADGTSEWLVEWIEDGAVNFYRGELQFPEMRRTLGEFGVNERAMADMTAKLRAGFVEVVFDPQFQKAMAIANDHHLWRTNPEQYALRHGFEPPAAYPGITDDALNDIMDTFDSEVASITQLDNVAHEPQVVAMRAEAADYAALTDALRKTKKLSEITDLEERMAATDELLNVLGAEKDKLGRVVQDMYGPDAQLSIMRDTGDGPVMTVEFPSSDTVALQEQYGGDFDRAMQAMMDGELTATDAYKGGMGMVARAYESYQQLDAALQMEPRIPNPGAELARTDNLRDYFRKLVAGAQEAIDNQDAKTLRGLVMRTDADGTMVASPQFTEMMNALDSNPPAQEFLQRFIESAWVADLDVWPSREAFRAWWLAERKQVATLAWSLEKNKLLLERQSRQWMETQLKQFPIEDVQQIATRTKEGIEALTNIDNSIDNYQRAMQGAPYEPDVGGYGTWEQRVTGADRVNKTNARRIAQQQTRLDYFQNLRDAIDRNINAMQRVSVPGQFKAGQAGSIEQGRRLVKQLDDLLSSEKVIERLAPDGLRLAEEVGLGAGVTAGTAIDPVFATLLESTVNNTKNIFTPYAVSELQRGLRNLVNLWKAGVTVTKPAFHIRNLIGGTMNNLIIGVTPDEMLGMWPDIMRFRKAMRRLERSGSVDIGSDVFEREVIQAVSKPNQEVFRQAWNDRVLQTSFTRAEDLYNPGAGVTWKPWDRNFALFQYGGRTMEHFEDLLRMTGFKHHFDAQLGTQGVDGATRYAHQMVNVAHFDYTALTPMERQIKNFVPFYVWTRRNIPLQLSVLTQNPTFMLWYTRARSNWNEQQMSMMDADGDPFLKYQAQQGFILPVSRSNDDGWARLIWSPQMPAYDLDNLPLWNTNPEGSLNPIDFGSVFNGGAWASYVVDNLGPGISIPMAMAQANEGGGNTNAKAGFNAVLAALDKVPVINQLTPDPNPAPDMGFAPDNDYRISKWVSLGIDAAVPWYDDYRAMLGIKPNNPYRAAGEGWLPGEDPAGVDDFTTRLMLGPMGRTFGRGAGFGWSTSTDLFFDALDQEEKLEAMRQSYRYRVGGQPDDGDEASAAELLRELQG